jgi:hypothetical protein
MGLVETIQSLSQIGWLGTPGRDSANSKSTGGRSRTSNPAGAQTPEEALAYIQLLSKAGRTDELAALLRHHPVFREAWQTLQQFSSTGSEAGREITSSLAAATPAPDRSGLPSPPGACSPSQLPRQGPAALEVAVSTGVSGKNPGAQAYPVLSSRPTRPLAAARQIYETQARLFTQEGANSPQISLRV